MGAQARNRDLEAEVAGRQLVRDEDGRARREPTRHREVRERDLEVVADRAVDLAEAVVQVEQADPRFPFTEPDYPVPDIRMGHEGTVWLTIEILPNGRVGAVHIDKSSGFDRLDAAAVREAHKWRMQPGTQDGIAIPMYKRVPVTFRLKD